MASKIPSTCRSVLVQKLTNKFRDATEVVTRPVQLPGPKELLIHNRFIGINASDINFTAGKYNPAAKPPFDCGFEGVGEVVSVGEEVKNDFKPGQAVAYMQNGAFTEYMVLPARQAMSVPTCKPEYTTLMVSGLTAAIALDKVGEIKKDDTVLVTAAAGGTGQFAVQIAKNAGCHVIGTCSSQEKVDALKRLGCDRPINYNVENISDVLKNEYPRGIDVVYESIGGDTFDTCVDRLATKGKLIIIGYISGYESDLGFKPTRNATLPQKLLPKSASIRGFFLLNWPQEMKSYFEKLVSMYHSGELKCVVDTGSSWPVGPFLGIDAIPDAVDYLYSRKSIGKIIVELPKEESSQL